MTGDVRAYTAAMQKATISSIERLGTVKALKGICGCLRREFRETACNLITLSVNENPKAVDYDPSFSYPQTPLGFSDDAFSKSQVKKKNRLGKTEWQKFTQTQYLPKKQKQETEKTRMQMKVILAGYRESEGSC